MKSILEPALSILGTVLALIFLSFLGGSRFGYDNGLKHCDRELRSVGYELRRNSSSANGVTTNWVELVQINLKENQSK